MPSDKYSSNITSHLYKNLLGPLNFSISKIITVLKSSSTSSNPRKHDLQSIKVPPSPPPSPLRIKMKSQFIIAFLSLFLTTALAVPTAKPSNTDPVEVCTEATDGEPCIVFELDGSIVEGRCIFDLVSRSCFPLLPSWVGMERMALTRLNSSFLVGLYASSNRFRTDLLEGVSWRKEEGKG